MMTLRAERLLSLPVRLHGIQVGRPVDLLLDVDEWKAIGLDIRCGDDVNRFLPLPTASVTDDEIVIRSPFLLLEEDQLAFYRQRTVALSSLRAQRAEQKGRQLGLLDDVVVSMDGTVAALVIGGREVPVDESVRIESENRVAAVS